MDAKAPSSAEGATAVAQVGLSEQEAEVRRRRGEANTAVSGTSRTYATILRTNVFSFYNTILFVIGATLLALGATTTRASASGSAWSTR
jgi:cation-transporting ATPase E